MYHEPVLGVVFLICFALFVVWSNKIIVDYDSQKRKYFEFVGKFVACIYCWKIFIFDNKLSDRKFLKNKSTNGLLIFQFYCVGCIIL